jgi:hypothetical protein
MGPLVRRSRSTVRANTSSAVTGRRNKPYRTCSRDLDGSHVQDFGDLACEIQPVSLGASCNGGETATTVKTMSKKEKKLEEIQSLLKEEIVPKLDRLREEKRIERISTGRMFRTLVILPARFSRSA